jgi:dimethylglycine dehydrogenase
MPPTQRCAKRAVESMRMEKGFLHWKADLITEFDPFETALDRFVKLDKPDFIGRDALLKRKEAGPTKKFVSLEISTDKTPALGGASLMQEGAVVGTITSGDWGHRIGKNLAYAFVDVSVSEVGTAMQLDLCGDIVDAQVIAAGPYDPEFARIRS